MNITSVGHHHHHRQIKQGLTSYQTHYRLYRRWVFTGQMTQLNSVKALKKDKS